VRTKVAITQSDRKKKQQANATITKTMTVEIPVSRREGHVTFNISARTCRKKASTEVLPEPCLLEPGLDVPVFAGVVFAAI